jgi:hypothetical protein
MLQVLVNLQQSNVQCTAAHNLCICTEAASHCSDNHDYTNDLHRPPEGRDTMYMI